ncbi:MAG: NRDE family protein [Pseudomonadales bacterium]|nr:NRDE family protein [Pseudomonadales bacterium]
MCLILFGIRPNESYRLALAANRDEFYGRPSAQADFWSDHPDILGGRDLKMGGTWLGVSRSGRFAAVTNFRETPPDPVPPRSRGELTSDFLAGDVSCMDYLDSVDRLAEEYRGFNLVIGEGEHFYYYSNRRREILELESGYYGLSNQLLNCDWPKSIEGRKRLSRLADDDFEPEAMFRLLFDPGNDEPFSASFLASPEYGTCASTVLTISREGDVYFEERNFEAGGKASGSNRFSFTLNQ